MMSLHVEFRSALPRGERRSCSGMPFCRQTFRSALPRGERPRGQCNWIDGPGFRSALPRGERQGRPLLRINMYSFRSALPRGERPTASPNSRPWKCFDPRSRAGSDHKVAAFGHGYLCFDPRSRAGSDAVEWECRAEVWVSIRAPARGATGACRFVYNLARVAIRAPARVATTVMTRDDGFVLFRSALPRGERPLIGDAIGDSSSFRSALPRGERPGHDAVWPRVERFDPRSRAGSDVGADRRWLVGSVSIRAPARGATFRLLRLHARDPVSIRAPARGATGGKINDT